MYRNVLKKHWYTLGKELKERWPDLTQSDVEYIGGQEDRLIGTVARRRHISAPEAKRDVQEFLEHLDPRQRPPE